MGEPSPLGQKCLVSDLDRRGARGRVPVEGEESAGPEGIDHRLHGLAVHPEGRELRSEDPPSRVLATLLSQADQAEEELARGLLPPLVQPPVEILGPAGQGS